VIDTKGSTKFIFNFLKVENLMFSFERNNPPVLRNINVQIPAGKIIGLTGTVGSGKSTFLKLLMRIAEPTAGMIYINGHSIKQLDLKTYRGLFSYVPQEPSLFSETIYNNITLGIDADENRVRQIIEICQLDEFIKSCPDGLNTMVGERGLRLSGGEKQRIAIARALMRNAPIFIFDDATSNLDAKTEIGLMEKIIKHTDKTIIIVSHRLSILSLCDYIYVLDKGSIMEQGTPKGLLKRKGLFWRLYQYQLMEDI